jgi:hypothetical protein
MFASGKVGWNASQAVSVEAGGRTYRCQLGINIVGIKSQAWDQDDRSAVAYGPAITIGMLGNIVLQPRTFSSGGVGWYYSDKIFIDGRKFQVGINISAHHSKGWPEDEAVDTAQYDEQEQYSGAL